MAPRCQRDKVLFLSVASEALRGQNPHLTSLTGALEDHMPILGPRTIWGQELIKPLPAFAPAVSSTWNSFPCAYLPIELPFIFQDPDEQIIQW